MVTWHRPPNQYKFVDITFYAEDISFTLNEYTSAQTLSADNFLVIIDASSGSVTVTLPDANSHTNRIYTIKKIDSSSNKVIVDANSTETIDGEETIELKLQYAYITIVCDGTEWFIIGGEYVKMEDTLEDLLDEQKDTTEATQKLLLMLGRIDKHISDEEIDLNEVQEELSDEFEEVLIDDVE